jgi:NitT/TauT family transport system ATP-binding protein
MEADTSERLLTEGAGAEAPVAELVHVSCGFRPREQGEGRILQDITLAVREGEFLALLGQSGSGKSTLLRCLTGLLAPTHGKVRCRGKNLRGIHPDLALVFQGFALFPWLTVEQNVAVGVLAKPLEESRKKRAVERAIELTGLTHYQAAYPREISGGMRQRVGIARALASDPAVLCLDEAFGSLDVLTAENLRQEILALWQSRVSRLRSIFMITHDIGEAVEMATRVCVLFPHPGRIGLEVSVPLPYPRDPRSPGFQSIVATIHDAITGCTLPDRPNASEPAWGEPSVGEVVPAAQGRRSPVVHVPTESLPNVSVGQLLGLLSILRDEPTLTNVYQIAEEIGGEFGETLALVKAAEMVELVETPKHEVVLTALGRQFLEAAREDRRELFRRQILKLRLFGWVETLLDEKGEVKAAAVVRKIAESLPHENPERLFQTVVAWGRYAGMLEFDPDSRRLRRGGGGGPR